MTFGKYFLIFLNKDKITPMFAIRFKYNAVKGLLWFLYLVLYYLVITCQLLGPLQYVISTGTC